MKPEGCKKFDGEASRYSDVSRYSRYRYEQLVAIHPIANVATVGCGTDRQIARSGITCPRLVSSTGGNFQSSSKTKMLTRPQSRARAQDVVVVRGFCEGPGAIFLYQGKRSKIYLRYAQGNRLWYHLV